MGHVTKSIILLLVLVAITALLQSCASSIYYHEQRLNCISRMAHFGYTEEATRRQCEFIMKFRAN